MRKAEKAGKYGKCKLYTLGLIADILICRYTNVSVYDTNQQFDDEASPEGEKCSTSHPHDPCHSVAHRYLTMSTELPLRVV